MKQGIKEKDIRDFEKYAMKLSCVLNRIREYKPTANAFLACSVNTYLCLMSDDHCNYDKDKQGELVVTEIDMFGFDGGDWR
jgi:hypothetical protein